MVLSRHFCSCSILTELLIQIVSSIFASTNLPVSLNNLQIAIWTNSICPPSFMSGLWLPLTSFSSLSSLHLKEFFSVLWLFFLFCFPGTKNDIYKKKKKPHCTSQSFVIYKYKGCYLKWCLLPHKVLQERTEKPTWDHVCIMSMLYFAGSKPWLDKIPFIIVLCAIWSYRCLWHLEISKNIWVLS